MRFASRQDAGRQLGQRLHEQGVAVDWVLGLPRGGVVVADEVARRLRRPLDVLVVRKIGHPWHREFAVGALAEPDIVIFDEATLVEVPVSRGQLDQVVAEETARLREYGSRFHRSASPPLQNQSVLLVDDGLANGRDCRGGGAFRPTAGGAPGDGGRAGGRTGRGRPSATRGGRSGGVVCGPRL
jgi:predicted phosphoribosyltransferase